MLEALLYIYSDVAHGTTWVLQFGFVHDTPKQVLMMRFTLYDAQVHVLNIQYMSFINTCLEDVKKWMPIQGDENRTTS